MRMIHTALYPNMVAYNDLHENTALQKLKCN
jgi:hypothetical protein